MKYSARGSRQIPLQNKKLALSQVTHTLGLKKSTRGAAATPKVNSPKKLVINIERDNYNVTNDEGGRMTDRTSKMSKKHIGMSSSMTKSQFSPLRQSGKMMEHGPLTLAGSTADASRLRSPLASIFHNLHEESQAGASTEQGT